MTNQDQTNQNQEKTQGFIRNLRQGDEPITLVDPKAIQELAMPALEHVNHLQRELNDFKIMFNDYASKFMPQSTVIDVSNHLDHRESILDEKEQEIIDFFDRLEEMLTIQF